MREKLGPLINEEKNKINDNSEITRTDSTLGSCPSSSPQWPVTSTAPAAQIRSAAASSPRCIKMVFFFLISVLTLPKLLFWAVGRLYWCQIVPEILTENIEHTLKMRKNLLFAVGKLFRW